MLPPDTPLSPRCLTIPELAVRWRCRISTIRRMVRDGRVAAIQLPGGGIRISPAAICQAEEGTLAVRPRTRARREAVDQRVLVMLGELTP
jgi:excisionase family DNA binding protein